MTYQQKQVHFRLSTTLPSKIHRKAEKPEPWSIQIGRTNYWGKVGGKKARKARAISL